MPGYITPIPIPIILSAISGDEIALASVILHYKYYIQTLATKVQKDDCGNKHLYIDEDMRLRLETKLIYAIITGFKVLPA